MKLDKLADSSIYSRVSPDKMLRDTRLWTKGRKFGRVMNICRQYGIKIEPMEKCIKYSAPKNRLQLFREKLHFSRTPYRSNPWV